jgi:predicted nucleic acid-binding protein
MNSMTDRYFVDTNVLVYARDAAFPDKQRRAHEVLDRLWRERSGRLSVQVCGEYYVTVTRKLKPGLDPESAWSDLEALHAWEPSALDFKTLQKAHEIGLRYGLAWWDSLIVASAFFAECTQILSEDLSVGQEYLGLRIVNPFQS